MRDRARYSHSWLPMFFSPPKSRSLLTGHLGAALNNVHSEAQHESLYLRRDPNHSLTAPLWGSEFITHFKQGMVLQTSLPSKIFSSRKTQHHQDTQGHTRVGPATAGAMKIMKGLEHMTWKRQKVGNAQPREKTLSIYLHTQRDITKSTSNSVMPHDRTRGNGHDLKFRQFQLIIRKLFYSEGGQALLTGCPGTACSLHPLIFLKPS